MSDDYEFDDNDDVLLNAFCTPPNKNAPETRLNEENNEIIPAKRLKQDERTSPVLLLSHAFDIADLEKNTTKLPNTTKRIFPGPAGILSDENQTDNCSQDTFSFFQDGAWKAMSKDFKISNSYLFDKFNIEWIKKEATTNTFVNQKAPFLAGILLSLEVSQGNKQKSINITLKDATGTIQGTILQNLYEEYANHFTLGSVLVLIQFGVLSCTCDKCDNHHLTITSNNLSAIYSGKEKVVIKQVDPEGVLKEYCDRKKELERLTTLKNAIRQTSSSSPNRCAYSTNTNMIFQNPCANRSILSTNTLNRSTNSSENVLNKRCTSETFLLPKVRSIDKSISETTVIKEVHDLNDTTNVGTSNTPTPPKKSFVFRNVNSLPLSSCSTLTISDSLPTSENTVLNFEENNFRNTNKKLTVDKNLNGPKIGTSLLSVRVVQENEELVKDILQDIDVNSLFDDDF